MVTRDINNKFKVLVLFPAAILGEKGGTLHYVKITMNYSHNTCLSAFDNFGSHLNLLWRRRIGTDYPVRDMSKPRFSYYPRIYL